MFFLVNFTQLKSSHRTSCIVVHHLLRADISLRPLWTHQIIFNIGIYQEFSWRPLYWSSPFFWHLRWCFNSSRIFMNIERHSYVIEVFYRIMRKQVYLNSLPRESSPSLMVLVHSRRVYLCFRLWRLVLATHNEKVKVANAKNPKNLLCLTNIELPLSCYFHLSLTGMIIQWNRRVSFEWGITKEEKSSAAETNFEVITAKLSEVRSFLKSIKIRKNLWCR